MSNSTGKNINPRHRAGASTSRKAPASPPVSAQTPAPRPAPTAAPKPAAPKPTTPKPAAPKPDTKPTSRRTTAKVARANKTSAAASREVARLRADVMVPRIAATEVFPVVENGKWPAKAVEGEAFPVRATVFREGHAAYGADAVLVYDPAVAPGEGFDLYSREKTEWVEHSRARMHDVSPGLDRYEAWLCPDAPGRWGFFIETWSDPYGTWQHDATIKIHAKQDVEITLEEGARILERAVAGQAQHNPSQKPLGPEEAAILTKAAAAMRNPRASAQRRLSAGIHSRVRHIMRKFPLRDVATRTRVYPLRVDRERALYGAWYEIFPRSIGARRRRDGSIESGTLRTAAEHIDYIADAGFDVVYLTPVHPIGYAFRKGPNNSLECGPNDPGSPYAIGSAEGGHDAIHPDLGTFEDFDYFVSRAHARGLEVALDFALQCSPDHPWVKEHPEWFSARSDGSIAYAENPPKKYQDIYPLNFDNDYRGLYNAIRDVLELWVSHGVKIFRVDNPHTKPVVFWQELLGEFNQRHPEVIFLAEAFTRPAMMRTLGMVGFHQSYTYFAWRNTKQEIIDYMWELANDTAHILRPTFWPATPDILTQYMVDGGPRGYAVRALLAATGAPSWGIQGGYEFVENVQRPGFEEQIDNEKYEYKIRDWANANQYGLTELFRRLNLARSSQPALHQLRNLTFHVTETDSILCFSKHVPAEFSPTGEPNTVIVVVNLDPHNRVSDWIHLDVGALGLPATSSLHSGRSLFKVRDLLTDEEYEWSADNYVDLDPWKQPGHVFVVSAL